MWDLAKFPTEIAETNLSLERLGTWITCAACSLDAKTIGVASGACVHVWIHGNGWTKRTPSSRVRIRCLTLSEAGDRLFVGAEKTVWSLDISTGILSSIDITHLGPVTSIHCSGDGSLLVTGSEDGFVRFWNNEAICPKRNHGVSVSCVRLSSDGRYALSGNTSGAVWLWDCTQHRVISEWNHEGPVRAAAFKPNEATVLTSSDTSSCLHAVE